MSLNETIEGLVLRSLDYKDSQKIITLFTPSNGILSLIVKGITRKKNHLLTLTSPFTQAEYHFRSSRSTLHHFLDGTLLNPHHKIRKSLEHIEAATHFSGALLSSQFPGKPAETLYQLLLVYLKYLPEFSEPSTLVSSFFLKLLKHEGHLSLSSTCSQCRAGSHFLHQGESYCKNHAPPTGRFFSPIEWSLLKTLLETRKISELKNSEISQELTSKIEGYFKSHYEK